MTGKEALLLSRPIRELSSQLEPERESSAQRPLTEGEEKEIFNRLRQLRTSLAKKEGLPAYCIFQDRTLREMARELPKTSDELLEIVGVGHVTLKKYGTQFLELISKIRKDTGPGENSLIP